MKLSKRKIWRFLSGMLWTAITGAAIFLLVAAARTKDVKTCKDVHIEIAGVSDNFFIDKKDIQKIIENGVKGNPVGKRIADFDLRWIENEIKKDVWVSNADLYFDNNNLLMVYVNEKEPVARIFSYAGGSFYIDSNVNVLPLSEKFSARLPVFTGFSGTEQRLSKVDSALLVSIKSMSMQIKADSFLMAMIDQVDITPQKTFQLIPKVGKQVIEFGGATDIEEKFLKLKLFYKKIMVKTGWERYSVINLCFNNQVVAKLRGQEDISADSLRTLQLLEIVASNAAQLAADSARLNSDISEKAPADISIIEQSKEREDKADDSTAVPVPAGPRPIRPIGPATVEPSVVQPIAPQQQNNAVGVSGVASGAAVVQSPQPVVVNNKPSASNAVPARPAAPKPNAATANAKPLQKPMQPKPTVQPKPKPVVPKAVAQQPKVVMPSKAN